MALTASMHEAAARGATGFSSGHALELQAVSRAFGALKAIDAVSFDVQAGQRYAVLGSNGAGKTTLFNAITGDFPPTAGRIRFFGEDITDLPPHERIRRGLRRTYQISQLFKGLSVLDSIFLALHQRTIGVDLLARRREAWEQFCGIICELIHAPKSG